jgi:hypothetical protein
MAVMGCRIESDEDVSGMLGRVSCLVRPVASLTAGE